MTTTQPSTVLPLYVADDVAATSLTRGALGRALFTAEEVASALAIAESLVRQLTQAGEIPCRRIGRLVRYAIPDIQAFVDSYDDRGYGVGR